MLQKSTEHCGVGQSGFTAGRNEADPLLDSEVQVRGESGPEDPFDEADDRFYGRGGILVPRDEPLDLPPGDDNHIVDDAVPPEIDPDLIEVDGDKAESLRLDRPGKVE